MSAPADVAALAVHIMVNTTLTGATYEAAGKAARALRILAAWLGAEAPFCEADVRAMAGLRPSVQARAC